MNIPVPNSRPEPHCDRETVGSGIPGYSSVRFVVTDGYVLDASRAPDD